MLKLRIPFNYFNFTIIDITTRTFKYLIKRTKYFLLILKFIFIFIIINLCTFGFAGSAISVKNNFPSLPPDAKIFCNGPLCGLKSKHETLAVCCFTTAMMALLFSPFLEFLSMISGSYNSIEPLARPPAIIPNG